MPRSRIERVCDKSNSRRSQKRIKSTPTPILARCDGFGDYADQNTLCSSGSLYESLGDSDSSISKEYCSAYSRLNPITSGVNDLTLINPSYYFLDEWPQYLSSHPSTVSRKSYLIYPRPSDPNLTIPFTHYGQFAVSQSFATNFNEDNIHRIVDHDFSRPIKTESFLMSDDYPSKSLQQFSRFEYVTNGGDIYMHSGKNLDTYTDSTPHVGNVGHPGIVIRPLKTTLPSQCGTSSLCLNSPSTLSSPSLTKRSSTVNTPISTAVLTPLLPDNNMFLRQNSYTSSEAAVENNIIPKVDNQWIEGDLGFLDFEKQQNQLIDAWFESMEHSNRNSIGSSASVRSIPTCSLGVESQLSPNQSNGIEDPNTFWDNYFCGLSPRVNSAVSPLHNTSRIPSTPESRSDSLLSTTVSDLKIANPILKLGTDIMSQASLNAFTSQYSQAQAPCSTPKLNDDFSIIFSPVIPKQKHWDDSSVSKRLATQDINSTVYASVAIHHPRPKRPIGLLRNLELLLPSDDVSEIESFGRKKKRLKKEPDDAFDQLISTTPVSSTELLQSNENQIKSEHHVPSADNLNTLFPFNRYEEQFFTLSNDRREDFVRSGAFLVAETNCFSTNLFRSGTSLTENPERRIAEAIITDVLNRNINDGCDVKPVVSELFLPPNDI